MDEMELDAREFLEETMDAADWAEVEFERKVQDGTIDEATLPF